MPAVCHPVANGPRPVPIGGLNQFIDGTAGRDTAGAIRSATIIASRSAAAVLVVHSETRRLAIMLAGRVWKITTS